ncbi:alpha/beta hydrolase [Arenimonas daejeonensis]|uniref:alpha/beta hydrolase n=1 Tax=Arenimonas daejeonensis TaxID=370777 RepID=UPI0011BEF298|nr:alpha/beta hydrolase [Arenimonas daejeonensis]
MRYLILAALAVVSGVCNANTGVAFVHGTGQQSNATADYWKPEFVNNVRGGLPNPANYVVINCDFTKYMWDNAAAGCLAGQLTTFINGKGITRLIVITHSNGGNVMRWILSNPTWDSRYPDIIAKTVRVNALAPSSAGTPLADAVIAGNVFESAVGWLLGYKNDAVRMQQTSWMASYNASWLLGTSGRPALPRTFRNVVGTDVDSAIWDSDSYCGGYFENVGLETTQLWLNSCSDGFLNCSSQSAAGSLWFQDKSRMRGSEPLSHNQSRRACFGLDSILRTDMGS